MATKRVNDQTKEFRGTLQQSRTRRKARSEVLSRWPRAPQGFTAAEGEAWKRLGQAAIASASVTDADLPLATLCAKAWARADALAADPKTKPTAVTSALRLAADLLRSLGLSTTTRTTEPAAPPDDAESKAERDLFGRPGLQPVRGVHDLPR